MTTRIIRLRVVDVTRASRLLAALLLIGAAACARGDDEADRARARPADQPEVASTEEDPHEGHDMTAEVDTADEHADHAAGGSGPGAAAAADPHAGHAAAPARPGATTAGDPHAAHTAVAPRPGAATAADPHAQHGTAGGQRPTAEGADPLAALVAALLADPDTQQRIAENPVLRQLWEDAAVRDQVNEVTDAAMAHEPLMELARSLVADPGVQRRIRADSALRALWADSSVRRHILRTEPQEQR